ncbi:hypothetical protein G4B88_030003 [Cannabis sativa]|uniref:Uncharacterized protein n=1 Tax=Cannabis sativa TaxID=3483 RepID=A0A7J6GAP1_CANSA|nr:hypothetical protein G4B88_030003 [Cannabis sativa]
MSSRPEFQAPPEIFYNDKEARKYTSSSRIIKIQAELTERALELLALPKDGLPRLLLDIDVALEREVEGDLLLLTWVRVTMGLDLVSGIGVSWLCNADKSSHNPKLRLDAFFGSLYRCFARGARAVFQVYPESTEQRVLIYSCAIGAGFVGSLVIDFPHSAKKRKEYLVLTCSTPVPKRKGDNSSRDEEDQTVITCSALGVSMQELHAIFVLGI